LCFLYFLQMSAWICQKQCFLVLPNTKLNDLERHNGHRFALLDWMCHIWKLPTSIWMRLDPHCPWQQCSRKNLVFLHMAIFAAEITENECINRRYLCQTWLILCNNWKMVQDIHCALTEVAYELSTGTTSVTLNGIITTDACYLCSSWAYC